MEKLVFEEKGALAEIGNLRNQYLDGLLEAQELYLELMIRKSRVFVIQSQERRIGYFLLGDGAVLLEYYVTQDNLEHVDTLFGMILEKFSIHKTLCKSFDHTLLSCCVGFQKKVSSTGILFREYKEGAALSIAEGITFRLANAGEAQKIIEINEEVFDNDEEVHEYIRNGQIFLFEKEKEMIGFGIFARVVEGRPEFDIGMCVDRRFRRRGYGEYIIRYLVEFCKQNGWRAICGCAIGNEASRRCLEKAGFIGRYRLLEFVFHESISD